MTTKEQVLQDIKILGSNHLITKEEIVTAFDEGSSLQVPIPVITPISQGGIEANGQSAERHQRSLNISEVMSYLGGGIVFLGIIIMLAQNWSTLSFITKALATLGSGVASYFAGVFLSRNEKTDMAGGAFHLISALAIPVGLYVVLNNAGVDVWSQGSQCLVSLILLAMYVTSYFVFRKTIFALFCIVFGTWLFFSLTGLLVGNDPRFDVWQYYQYRVFATGAAYIALGHSFSKTNNAPLSGVLYSFGSLALLSSALTLGAWSPNQNVFWELSYPVFICGILYLSVRLKIQSFLTWGTIFLMAYILKITSEYFTIGLGWPLSLVISGLSLIGVGYMSVAFKKKYLVK